MNFNEIVQAIQARRFLPSKPIREIRPLDLQRNPEIIASRKYNGNFSTAVVQADGIEFYTASSLLLTKLNATPFWENGSWQESLRMMPPGTILLGEIFIPSVAIEDLDAFQEWYTWHRSGLVRTDTPPPQAATFRAFDLLVCENQALCQRPYGQRLEQIPNAIRVDLASYRSLSQAAEAQAASQRSGIEGYVFWNANSPSLCKLKGSHEARGGAWKVKPVLTETFALLAFINPTPAALVMTLGNLETQFNCGSGLTTEERREMIALFQKGKPVQVAVTHNGYDEQGRPERPRAVSFHSL